MACILSRDAAGTPLLSPLRHRMQCCAALQSNIMFFSYPTLPFSQHQYVILMRMRASNHLHNEFLHQSYRPDVSLALSDLLSFSLSISVSLSFSLCINLSIYPLSLSLSLRFNSMCPILDLGRRRRSRS